MSTSGGNVGTGTISSITSTGASVVITGGTGPTTNVEVASPRLGQLIATQKYLGATPGTQQTYSVAATTVTAVDTTNLTLALTVPASGNVDIEVETFVGTVITATASVVQFALLNHTGGAVVGEVLTAAYEGIASSTELGPVRLRWHLTGLTPGALQLDIAAGVTNASGSSATIYVMAGTSKTVPNSTGIGVPFLIQAFAA